MYFNTRLAKGPSPNAIWGNFKNDCGKEPLWLLLSWLTQSSLTQNPAMSQFCLKERRVLKDSNISQIMKGCVRLIERFGTNLFYRNFWPLKVAQTFFYFFSCALVMFLNRVFRHWNASQPISINFGILNKKWLNFKKISCIFLKV